MSKSEVKPIDLLVTIRYSMNEFRKRSMPLNILISLLVRNCNPCQAILNAHKVDLYFKTFQFKTR